MAHSQNSSESDNLSIIVCVKNFESAGMWMQTYLETMLQQVSMKTEDFEAEQCAWYS